jgi:uncharacterized protein YceK
MKSLRYLILIVTVIFTSGCAQLLPLVTNTQSIEQKYAEIAFKEIFDNTRGSLSIQNVDWICLSSYHSNEPIPVDKDVEEGIMLEVCSYYITYKRDASTTEQHAIINVFFGKINDFENDEFDEIFEIENEFNLTIEELDERYLETMSFIREEFDILDFYEYLNNETDVFTGSFSRQEIRRIVGNLD